MNHPLVSRQQCLHRQHRSRVRVDLTSLRGRLHSHNNKSCAERQHDTATNCFAGRAGFRASGAQISPVRYARNRCDRPRQADTKKTVITSTGLSLSACEKEFFLAPVGTRVGTPGEFREEGRLGPPIFEKQLSGAFLDNSAGGLFGRVLLGLVSVRNEPKRSRVLIWILVVSREKQNGKPNRRRD